MSCKKYSSRSQALKKYYKPVIFAVTIMIFILHSAEAVKLQSRGKPGVRCIELKKCKENDSGCRINLNEVRLSGDGSSVIAEFDLKDPLLCGDYFKLNDELIKGKLLTVISEKKGKSLGCIYMTNKAGDIACNFCCVPILDFFYGIGDTCTGLPYVFGGGYSQSRNSSGAEDQYTLYFIYNNGKTKIEIDSYKKIDGTVFYEKGCTDYVWHNDKTYGGYDRITDIVTSSDNKHIMFTFEKNNKNYVRVDDKVFGPFKDVWKGFFYDDSYAFEFKSGTGKHYLLFDNKKYGPYCNVKLIKNDYGISFIFKKNWRDKKNYMSIRGKVYEIPPGTGYVKVDETTGKYILQHDRVCDYFVQVGKRNFGPYQRVERIFFTYDSKPGFLYRQNKKHMLWINNKRFGPLEIYKTSSHFSSDNKIFCYIKNDYRRENNSYILINDKYFGPFENIEFIRYDFNGNNFKQFRCRCETRRGYKYISIKKRKNSDKYIISLDKPSPERKSPFWYERKKGYWLYLNGKRHGPYTVRGEVRNVRNYCMYSFKSKNNVSKKKKAFYLINRKLHGPYPEKSRSIITREDRAFIVYLENYNLYIKEIL